MNLSIIKQIILSRKRSLIALVTLVMVAFSIELFISLYQQPRLDKSRAEWAQLRAEERRGASSLSREIVYKNGQSDFAKFKGRIYPKKQFARFIAELYETADRSKLDVSTISYKPEINQKAGLIEYALGLALVGNYQQLKKFINDLETFGTLLHIDSLSFTSQGSSEQVQLQLQFTAYFSTEEQ